MCRLAQFQAACSGNDIYWDVSSLAARTSLTVSDISVLDTGLCLHMTQGERRGFTSTGSALCFSFSFHPPFARSLLPLLHPAASFQRVAPLQNLYFSFRIKVSLSKYQQPDRNFASNRFEGMKKIMIFFLLRLKPCC